jgi:hypothetical protein
MTDLELLDKIRIVKIDKLLENCSFYQSIRPSIIKVNPITDLTGDQFILWLNMASPYELESGRIELETVEKMCATRATGIIEP